MRTLRLRSNGSSTSSSEEERHERENLHLQRSRSAVENVQQEWYVGGEYTVGQVRSTVSDSGQEDEYMCVETGIGSGTLHRADSLFPSEQAALDWCGAANLNIQWEEV